MADDHDPLERLVPALTALRFPDEPLATCARCAMAARVHGPPEGIAFTAPARCCTYHPTLPNWLAGRALQRGDLGAERIRTRLGDSDGVEPLCIAPGSARADAWRHRPDDAFGRDAALTCPFWAEGDLGCSIHRDRNAVGRTWFCRVERGARGHAAWMQLKTLRTDLEHRLSRYAASGEAAAGALLFSCMGRGRNLYGHDDHETKLLRDTLGSIPLNGFFCNGEIGPVDDTTYLHGYTSALALFRPRD